MKGFKRLLSVIIVLSMLISMVPAVSAESADPVVGDSGVTVKYTVAGGEEYGNYTDAADGVFEVDTYAGTNGLWTYDSVIGSSQRNVRHRNAYIVNEMSGGSIVIRINVPKGGDYTWTQSRRVYFKTNPDGSASYDWSITSANVGIYTFPVETTENVETALAGATPLFTYSCRQKEDESDEVGAEVLAELGKVNFPAAGEYYVVFKPQDGGVMNFGTITLDGGDGAAPISVSAFADKTSLFVGQTATVSATGHDSVGGTFSSGFTFSSSDDDIATVDPVTGVVTAVEVGTVRITVTAGEISDSVEISVRVRDESYSGIKAKYVVGNGGNQYFSDGLPAIDTYEGSKGAWEYYDNSGDLTGGLFDKAWHRVDYIQGYSDPMIIKIKVPAAGKYTWKQTRRVFFKTMPDGSASTDWPIMSPSVGIYIFKVGSVSGNVKAAINEAGSPSFTFSTREGDDGQSGILPIELGEYDFPEAGEYYIVYCPTDGGYFNFGTIELNGGDDTAPMIAFASVDKRMVYVGQTATVSATGYDSVGDTITSGFTFASDDEDVATVDAETGIVTPVSTGVATITATLGAISDSVEIEVKEPNHSGVTLKYTVVPEELGYYTNGVLEQDTYVGTKGAWEIDSAIGSGLGNLRHRVGYIASTGNNLTAVIRINVPVAGDYSWTQSRRVFPQYNAGGVANSDWPYTSRKVGVYLFPVATTDNVATALNGATPLFTYSTAQLSEDDEVGTEVASDFGNVTFEEAGEYYVVFKPEDGLWINFGHITLDGGDGEALTYAEVSVDKKLISIGEKTKVKISAVYGSKSGTTPLNLTDGSVAISYESLTPEVVEVDPATGDVTAIAGGVAKIKSTASKDGIDISVVSDINVFAGTPSGSVAVYDTSRGFADGSSVTDITYDDTDNFWAYEGSNVDSPATAIKNMAKSSHISVSGMGEGKYFAMRLNVPKAGAYFMSVDRMKTANGGDVGIYVLPGDTADIAAAIADDTNKVYEGNWNGDDSKVASETVGEVNFAEAGDYIVVYKGESAGIADLCVGKITLNGGNNAELMKANYELDALKIRVDGTCESLITGIMSDETTATKAQLTVSYEALTPEIATIDAKGVVTGKDSGTARFKATVSYNGRTVYAETSVPVVYAVMSGIHVEYPTYESFGHRQVIAASGANKVGYEKTKGFWELAEVNPSDTIVDMWSGRGICAYLSVGGYYALRIRVPKAGAYDMSVWRNKITNCGTVGIYILPGDTADIASALNGDTRVYIGDWYAKENQGSDKINLGPVEFPTAGEYYVVYKAESRNELGNANVVAGRLILDGGDGKMAISASMSFDTKTINIGGSAFVSLVGYMTDESEIDVSKATVTYSSLDETVAEVTQEGEVIGKAAGTARIKAVVNYNGDVIEAIGEIPVRALSETENSYVYSFLDHGLEHRRLIKGADGYDPISFADTNDTWAFEAISANNFYGYANPSTYIDERYGLYSEMNIEYGGSPQDWLALRIKIPEEGDYEVSLMRRLATDGAKQMGVYLLPGNTPSAGLLSAMTEDRKIGTFNNYHVSSNEISRVGVGLMSVAAPGEYILCFKAEEPCAGRSARLHIGDIIFGKVKALKSIRATTEKPSIKVGETSGIILDPRAADGSKIDPSTLIVSYRSNDENIATVDPQTGIITGVAEGVAQITITASDGNTEFEMVVDAIIGIDVWDDSGIAEMELIAPNDVFVGEKGKAYVELTMNSGVKVNVPASYLTFAVENASPAGAATVDADGTIYAHEIGSATITASGTFRGEDIYAEKVITFSEYQGKQEPVIFTPERIAIARENISKYSWAKSAMRSAVAAADPYVNNLDLIYNSIPAEGLPRAYRVGMENDPEYSFCRFCGKETISMHGGFSVNFFRRPWKMQCQECKRYFPTNDFEKLYELGLENGVYDVDRAIAKNEELVRNGEQGYLVNILYPEVKNDPEYTGRWSEWETNATWGVDAGRGYDTGRKYSNGVKEVHVYVPYIAKLFWDKFAPAMNSLVDAYIYTGERKYGVAGAILLDRVADIYPDLYLYQHRDYPNGSGGIGSGKFGGAIHDCTYTTHFAEATDAFFPLLKENDPEVISYLNKKAIEYGYENDKSTGKKIWTNWADGILKETLPAAEKAMIYGNFGMQQVAMATAAVSLNQEPYSSDILEFVFRTGGYVTYEVCTGGNVMEQLINNTLIDRDGFGNEVSPMYNAGWISGLLSLAEVLSYYENCPEEYDIWKNSKWIKMLTALPKLTLVDSHTANIGDSSGTAALGVYGGTVEQLSMMIQKLKEKGYGDEVISRVAKLLYLKTNKKTDNIHYDIFTKNPESIKTEILNYVNMKDKRESDILTGYGFAVLRDGERVQGSGKTKNTLRDFWMYFGKNSGHNSYDLLNIGADAYGLEVIPDLGYFGNTLTQADRIQWNLSSISHNTVTVDHQRNVVGLNKTTNPLHFEDAGKVKVMDADAAEGNLTTSIFRRTFVMVEANPEVSYGVDFFRVKGGSSHVYSFHALSEEARVIDDSLNLVKQVDENGNYVGTMVGADVPYGPDPNSPNDWYYQTVYPMGYTWFKNVRRDSDPARQFAVEFDITDYRGAVEDSSDIHVRMTQINREKPKEVAITAGMVPVYSANEPYMPPTFDFVLTTHEGKNLDTLFTTVIEPYKGARYIDTIEEVAITPTDNAGALTANDASAAVKVTKTDGQIDYVVYATNNTVTYDVGGVFNFRGIIGVYSVKDGEVVYRYVNDGDIIGESTNEAANYKGTIGEFTTALALENTVDLTFEGTAATAEEIKGRLLSINNDRQQNAVYVIEDAEDLGDGKVRASIGDVSFIRAHKDPENIKGGYVYNIAKGQSFTIANSYLDDSAPIVEPITDRAVSVGNKMEYQVVASSPLPGKTLTYVGESLPTNAKIDPDTGLFSWKPTASQVGENQAIISVVDSDGRRTTISFKIRVLGASGPAGGGGGGGGGGDVPITPVGPTDPTDPTTPVEPEDPTDPTNPGEGTGTGTGTEEDGFIDLGNHGWAADDINALADAGIIKGTSARRFSPANNITRADFAILLVRAFELANENEENFADVNPSDYFAAELAIARNEGIVNGIGDNKYNPRGHITRQDMMLIVYRALIKLGVELEVAGEIDMPGFEDTADYAKEAVATLIANGLVNGKSGNVAPLDNTTRAEVAVLISRILDFIEASKEA